MQDAGPFQREVLYNTIAIYLYVWYDVEVGRYHTKYHYKNSSERVN